MRTRSKIAAVGITTAALGAVLAPTAGAAPDSDWDRLAECESGGNWSINTGNGFYGGLQFHPQTWTGHGGGKFAGTADQASRAQQIAIAERVLDSQGWGAWPACSAALGLSSGVDLRDEQTLVSNPDGTTVINAQPRPESQEPYAGNILSEDRLDQWADFAVNVVLPQVADIPKVLAR